MEIIEADLGDNGFRLIEPIGSGGSATCYLVENIRYSNHFVCKVIINPDIHSETYLSEIKALKALGHPNIVRIFDYFKSDNNAYIILEYCEGGNLMDFISKHDDLDINKKFLYIDQLLHAIQYLHDHNIAHHDIKPANFLIDKNDRLKLSDFGISRKYNVEEKSTLYQGTLQYLSPEILLHRPYDPFKADVYSIGASIFTILTGEVPYKCNDAYSLKKLILSADLHFPQHFPKTLIDIIKICMDPNPFYRPSVESLIHNWEKNFMKPPKKTMERLPSLNLYRRELKIANENRRSLGPIRDPISAITAGLIKSRSKQLFIIRN